MTTCSVVGTPARFARCLANFQVDELLQLKKSVQRMEEMASLSNNMLPGEAYPAPTTDCPEGDPLGSHLASEMPERLALMADRGGDHDSSATGGGGGGPWQSHHPVHHPPPPWVEQKPSKLQTLFQISITALAFLSFGGYLLCLIVQAIKSKGTTYFHPVATATTTSTNGNVKRIKIYRRSRRSSSSRRRERLLLQDYASYMKDVRAGQRLRMLT